MKRIKISETQFKKLFREDYYESRKPVEGYVDSNSLIGQHLWAHTNRTNRNNGWNGMIGIYDATPKGRKVGNAGRYTNEIRFKSPIFFQTSESGAKRIQKSREEGADKRTLIAGVSGIVIPTEGSLSGFDEINYNPFNPGYFYKVGDNEFKKITNASEVYFKATEDGNWIMMAKDIEYNKTKLQEEYISLEKPTFEDLYNSFFDKMLKTVCKKYTKDDDKAQEYCQTGFIKAWEKYDKYENKGSIEGWIRMIIRNTILDSIRKENKMKYQDDGEEPFDFEKLDITNDNSYSEMSKSMSDVRNIMNQLPPQYQRVFRLYYIEGLKHEEIAEELGISVGTSKSNLSKAKKKIQNILGKNLYTEDEETGGSSTPSSGGGWTSGASSYNSLTRGPANPIGNTKWESGVSRGPANPL